MAIKKTKSTAQKRESRKPTTESALIRDLSSDLLEAYQSVKRFALQLGEQHVYASGKAIIFSKRNCYFFVRPKKTYLEIVLFLESNHKIDGFASVRRVSKKKSAYTFKLIHADQIDQPLTRSLEEAYKICG